MTGAPDPCAGWAARQSGPAAVVYPFHVKRPYALKRVECGVSAEAIAVSPAHREAAFRAAYPVPAAD